MSNETSSAPITGPVYFEATITVRYEVPKEWYDEQGVTDLSGALASENVNIDDGDYLISMLDHASSDATIRIVDSLDLPVSQENFDA